MATPTSEGIDRTEYIFQLDGELETKETWLACGEQKFDGGYKCAEFLLFDALAEK
jgi:hypothetical protein